ncbi:MAG: hypothetical protein DI539_15615 [Flavobacterium psychrophilum]|nr:MAG: hypothetical protein DI539_15615 [Flavobacterium psychrophilum]
MKMWILAMAMTMSVGANAQQRNERPEPLKPEQRAELQSKKMTLALDLNEKQQKDLKQLLIEQGKQRAEFRRQHMADRPTGKKLTGDERFAMRNKMLDDRIAMNRQMKKILSDDQFIKFEKLKMERHHNLRKNERKHKIHNRR